MKRRGFLRGMFGGILVTSPIAKVLMKIGVPERAFNPTLLPIVRRVMPNIIAADLLTVQSMTEDAGEIFNLPISEGVDEYPFEHQEPAHTDCWGQQSRGDDHV